MYLALIVDDEKEIREGLASWQWADLQVEVAGCCAHGLEALRFIAAHPVDILITDIRMPFMDGIELMEAVSRQYPFVHTVVLSGYSEFEYARKAMQLGAADYILKPISYENMAGTICRLVARLNERKQAEERMTSMQRKSRQFARILRGEFLSSLFQGPLSDDEMELNGVEGEVMLDSCSYSAVILRLDRAFGSGRSLTGRELELFVFALDNILDAAWDGQGRGYHIVNHETTEAFLLSRGENDRERFVALMQRLLKYRGLFRSTFTIAVGPAVASPALLHKSLAAARMALPACPENHITFCPAPAEADPEAEPAHEQAVELDVSETREKLDNKILHKAKKFIRDNYCRSITLKEVAEHVYVSPGYLSALFKEENETFLKYLTALRIGRAKELMADSRYKIYEIVEMVGYSDPAYFSEVFKKFTGMTPNEYRN